MSALSFLRSTVKHVAKRAEKTSASVAGTFFLQQRIDTEPRPAAQP